MKRIDHAIVEFKEMDEFAVQASPIHSIHPIAKFFTTVLYILITVSFGKYELSKVITMVLYPVILFEMSGITYRAFFYKLRIVLPLVCAVGIINPFLDKTPLMLIGNTVISGGVVSMVTLILKGVFCLMVSFLLAATTPFDSLCKGLRKIHIPGILVSLLLLTYRYISVMMNEISVMTDAYLLRAPGQKGIVFSAWGTFLGQLLLRSVDRADELYASMRLRGFNGNFDYAPLSGFRFSDALFLILSAGFMVLFKFVDVANLLGSLFVR